MNATGTRCARYSRRKPPPLLGVRAAAPDLYPALLESSAPHPTAGRFDILLAGAGERPLDEDCLGALERCWQRERPPNAAARLPFAGGWLIYLGYEHEVGPVLREAAAWLEEQVNQRPGPTRQDNVALLQS